MLEESWRRKPLRVRVLLLEQVVTGNRYAGKRSIMFQCSVAKRSVRRDSEGIEQTSEWVTGFFF